jgi:hypothetical protein
MNQSAAHPSTQDSLLPRLAPPGAGLPAVELFFARLMVRWQSKRTSRQESAHLFASEREALLNLAAGKADSLLAKPALIKRLPGLEDSSRNWSVLMTLDHLRIVNDQIAMVIGLLAQGKTPSSPASTAAVKPSPDVDATVIESFKTTCLHFENTVASISNLATPLKFPHPWFGPMDGAAWHFMAAFHMRLHRKQIEQILIALTRP